MDVEVALADHLAATASLVPVLQDAPVYQLKLPERVTLPAIRVQLIDEPTFSHLRGTSKVYRSLVQIDAYAAEASDGDPYAEASLVAQAIDAALTNRAPITRGDPVAITILNARRTSRRALYEPGELRQVRILQEYVIWSQQP